MKDNHRTQVKIFDYLHYIIIAIILYSLSNLRRPLRVQPRGPDPPDGLHLQAAGDGVQGAQVQGEGGAEARVAGEAAAAVLDQAPLLHQHRQRDGARRSQQEDHLATLSQVCSNSDKSC